MRLFKTPRFFRLVFPRKTWGFSRLDESVYLTFDDGPDPTVTTWVLDFLKENHIKATFFCVGENVRKHPETYERILKEGHSVGNHSMNHLKGIQTSTEEYVSSVDEASKLIESNLFRPPYGRITMPQTLALRSNYKIIMWTWLSYDFDHSFPLDEISQRARKSIKSGDIIVLHDNPKCFERMQSILPEIVLIIKEKKLAFKAISQR